MNIVVNGGTRGIGKEIVWLLAREKGNRIFVTGRNSGALKKLSAAQNGNIFTFRLDLSGFDREREQFLKAVKAGMKSVDVLINTAGSLTVKEFLNFPADRAREMMEINFFGPAGVISTLYPLMKKGSHIVNISSMGGFQGSSKYRGMSFYSASKAALSCLSECLAAEFRDAGISVNCLALGSVQTEMFEEAFPGYTAEVGPKEMAQFIIDFAMNGNRYFNGKVLPVAVSNP